MFAWFRRRIRRSQSLPADPVARAVAHSPATAEESERLIEDALIAALTGHQREEYIAALTERAETMEKFDIDDGRALEAPVRPRGWCGLRRRSGPRPRNCVN